VKRFTHSRGRRVGAIATTVFLIATCAFGFYLAEDVFNGSVSTQGGKAAPVEMSANLTMSRSEIAPGEEHEIKVLLDNTTGKTVGITKVEGTTTTSTPECKPEWFYLGGASESDRELLAGTGFESVEPGEHITFESNGQMLLGFRELPEVNQSACEGATVTEHLTIRGHNT
jgi:hypothetical protein